MLPHFDKQWSRPSWVVVPGPCSQEWTRPHCWCWWRSRSSPPAGARREYNPEEGSCGLSNGSLRYFGDSIEELLALWFKFNEGTCVTWQELNDLHSLRASRLFFSIWNYFTGTLFTYQSQHTLLVSDPESCVVQLLVGRQQVHIGGRVLEKQKKIRQNHLKQKTHTGHTARKLRMQHQLDRKSVV